MISIPTIQEFSKRASYQKLLKLAENPYDLTAPNALSPERIQTFQAQALDFTLSYGTERVTLEVMDTLKQLALEAKLLEQFHAMNQGEILNQIVGYDSENRAVLHTALRNFSSSSHGLSQEATLLARQEQEKLKTFLHKIEQEKRWKTMVLVGIGGSDLGPRALYLALQGFLLPERRVEFISNVDPDDAAQVLSRLTLSETLVVIVSKSGTTLETYTNEQIVENSFLKQGLQPSKHFIAVTGKGSSMDDSKKYLEVFYIWDYIGGRFSSTSMVGGVILSFALGYSAFEQLLQGAHAMDTLALKESLHENLPLLKALLGIWNRHFLGYPSVAILPYSQALIRFTAHLQQCDMESNGKRINRRGEILPYPTGPLVWGEVGTNGQHSFYQLLHQGQMVIPVEFIGFRESQWGRDFKIKGTTSQQKLLANLLAQSLALATGQKASNPNKVFPGNRPNSILMGQKLTPYALGALLAYYEAKIVFQGFFWNINSFDQEGVQLGKVLANTILKEFERINQKSTASSTAPPSISALMEICGLNQ